MGTLSSVNHHHHHHHNGLRTRRTTTGGGGGTIRAPSSACLIVLLTAIPSFAFGSMFAYLLLETTTDTISPPASYRRSMSVSSSKEMDQLVQEHFEQHKETLCAEHARTVLETHQDQEASEQHNAFLLPPETVGRFAVGMSRINKQEFAKEFDLGVPLDRVNAGAEELLMIYGNDKALPQTFGDDPNAIPELNVQEATANCEFMNIVLTDHGKRKQCIAIVPQYESYHLQKWMRLDDDTHKPGASGTLQLVSRGLKGNGYNEFGPPTLKDSKKHMGVLLNYISNLDEVTAELQVILDKIAIDNTVIVMVCNFGQSELLMNFVCTARARNFDLSNIIVFTTDEETTDLVTGLGLTAYYDRRNFGDIPSGAARRYGDNRFVAMMLAKVICVQLVSQLGFDFLFQDVDMVWYQNPLEYFRTQAKQYDVFFQDDGGHSVRYAPYSANSGFYFVRHNDRTRHFLTSILMAGDLVLSTDSHQQALIATLNEHVSLYGLKAKVLSRDTEEFPGGFHYHMRNKKFMRQVISGTTKPYIFHMSWTHNKDNKLKFFKQLGQWYVQPQCVQQKVGDIDGADANDLIPSCCSKEALFECFYKDKPSMRPCKNSPSIDEGKDGEGRPSWW